MEGCGCGIIPVSGKGEGENPSMGVFGSLRTRLGDGSSDRSDCIHVRFRPTGGVSS